MPNSSHSVIMRCPSGKIQVCASTYGGTVMEDNKYRCYVDIDTASSVDQTFLCYFYDANDIETSAYITITAGSNTGSTLVVGSEEYGPGAVISGYIANISPGEDSSRIYINC